MNRFPTFPTLAFALLLPLVLPTLQAQEEDAYQEAFVAYKSGKSIQALELVDAMLVKDPSPRALELKGRILHETGKYKEAEDFYFAALGKDPGMISPHFYLGEAAFRRKSWSESIQYFRVHISKVEDSPKNAKNSILKLIYCYIATGNLPEAARWITTLDPTDDFNPAYYFARAAMAFATGKTSEYNEALQQARTVYSNEVYNQFEPDLLFTLKNMSKPASVDELTKVQ